MSAKAKYNLFDELTLAGNSLADLNAVRISPILPQKDLEIVGGMACDVDAGLAVLRSYDPFALLGLHTKSPSKPRTEETETVPKFPYDPSVGFSWDGDV